MNGKWLSFSRVWIAWYSLITFVTRVPLWITSTNYALQQSNLQPLVTLTHIISKSNTTSIKSLRSIRKLTEIQMLLHLILIQRLKEYFNPTQKEQNLLHHIQNFCMYSKQVSTFTIFTYVHVCHMRRINFMYTE